MSEIFRFQLEIPTGTFGTPFAEYCSGSYLGDFCAGARRISTLACFDCGAFLLGGLSVHFLRVLRGVCARMRAHEGLYARDSKAGRAPLGCQVNSVWLRHILFVPWRVGHSSHASRVLVLHGLLPVFQVGTRACVFRPHKLWVGVAVLLQLVDQRGRGHRLGVPSFGEETELVSLPLRHRDFGPSHRLPLVLRGSRGDKVSVRSSDGDTE